MIIYGEWELASRVSDGGRFIGELDDIRVYSVALGQKWQLNSTISV